jgi:hypothetical protein
MVDEEEDDIQIIGGQNKQTVVLESIKSVEDAWIDAHAKQEKPDDIIASPEAAPRSLFIFSLCIIMDNPLAGMTLQ